MATPLRESVLAAMAARLQDTIPDVPVERARRGPPSLAEFPRIIVRGLDAAPDETQSPMETFWTISAAVTAYVKATTDLAAEQAMNDLHARVVAALQMAELGSASIQPTLRAGEMALYSAADSDVPAGEFTIVVDALAIAPTGSPYAP